jgi:erythromycin esterase-like protein
MSPDIRDVVPGNVDLLGLGEPTHWEPAFGAVRNEIFAQLVGLGFRSIALETDRVAAFAVDDHVQHGTGDLDAVLAEGFSHDFGAQPANRRLVDWLRQYNVDRPAGERLACHGFDAPTENTSAPSPRPYLEYARDYLDLDDLDIAALAGDDDRWSRDEAILDATRSMGATPAAVRLRTVGEELRTTLYGRAPELIARTSRAAWRRARTYLDAGRWLLHYHAQAARPVDPGSRIGLLLATREALMAANLLDIRAAEAGRGPTLVFAHNLHLRRGGGLLGAGSFSAGAIAEALGVGCYRVIAGSLGRSDALGLPEPAPDTAEGRLQHRVTGWGLVAAGEVAAGRPRRDTGPRPVYFPLEPATVEGVDAILHITGRAGTTVDA